MGAVPNRPRFLFCGFFVFCESWISFMHIEYLNERTKVRADFEGGRAQPVLFKRGNRTLRVERLAASWEDRDGGAKVFYYSVEAEGAVYQLSWRVQDNLWYVDAVMMD
jgi:hypothetical protein